MLPRKENIIQIKVDQYTDRIVKMYQYLVNVKNEFIFSKQILRSGTSIGANVVESKNAQSSKDFVSKMNIALKEADETDYWLGKLYTGNYITEHQYQSMHNDNEEIVKILTKIIKTMKQKYDIK